MERAEANCRIVLNGTPLDTIPVDPNPIPIFEYTNLNLTLADCPPPSPGTTFDYQWGFPGFVFFDLPSSPSLSLTFPSSVLESRGLFGPGEVEIISQVLEVGDCGQPTCGVYGSSTVFVVGRKPAPPTVTVNNTSSTLSKEIVITGVDPDPAGEARNDPISYFYKIDGGQELPSTGNTTIQCTPGAHTLEVRVANNLRSRWPARLFSDTVTTQFSCDPMSATVPALTTTLGAFSKSKIQVINGNPPYQYEILDDGSKGLAFLNDEGEILYVSGLTVGSDLVKVKVTDLFGQIATVDLSVSIINSDLCRPGQVCFGSLISLLGFPFNSSTGKQCSKGQPVNIGTGSLWHEFVDFQMKGRTPETQLMLKRTYLSQAPLGVGDFGPNWKHNWETELELSGLGPQGGAVIWIDESGGPWRFTSTDGETFQSPNGSDVLLVKTGSGFEIRKVDRSRLLFNSSGKLTDFIDRFGESLSLAYDSNQKLQFITGSFAGTVEIVRNSAGRITRIKRLRDRLEHRYYYDTQGRLVKTVDFDGLVHEFQYNSSQVGTNAHGLLSQIKDPLGRKYEFFYYDDGRASKQIEPEGGTLEFRYSAPGEMMKSTSVKELDGSISTCFMDEHYRPIKYVRGDGSFTYQTWNAEGYISTKKDPLGFVTEYSYDNRGNPISIKRPEDPAPSTYSYDPQFGTLLTMNPVVGYGTVNTVDSQTGTILQTVRGGRGEFYTLNFTYDSFGNLLGTDNGRASYSNQRDGNGFLTYQFDSHNPQTMEYDVRGREIKRTWQSGRVVELAYDNYDRVISVMDSNGPDTFTKYDAMGKVLQRTVSDGSLPQTTRYVWDGQDRLVKEIDPLGRETKYTYSKKRILKDPIAVEDPAGRVKRFEYDVLGRKIAEIDARGGKTKFSYNKRGDLVSVTDAVGNVTRFEYDGNGRKVKEIRPSLIGKTVVEREILSFYDGSDRKILEEHRSASGGASRFIEYEYDGFDRVIRKTLKRGSVVEDEAVFQYEEQLDGELLKRADNFVAKLGFTRNPAPPFSLTGFQVEAAELGNPKGLIEESFSVGRDVTGEISSIIGNLRGNIYNKSYDPSGRLTGVDSGALRTAIAYDGFGRKVKVSHSDGTTGQINYDSLNRIVNMQWKERGRDSVFQALSYDLAGNITKMAREFGSYQIQYDETDQLVKSEFQGMQGAPDYDREFQYDLVGNAISGSRGHGEFYSNFLTQNGSSKFEADGDGFGETTREISANQVKSYGYRADGKISSFLEGNLSVSYFYDALDRLAAKMISQNKTGFTNSYVHLGDEDRILLGKAGDALVTKYIQGQGVNEHLGEVKGTESKAYVTDHLGSVLNSEVVGRWKTYGLFGEIYQKANLSSTTEPVTFGFTGHMVDRESGLNRTKHRQYDSEAGRWLSQDPIGADSYDLNYYRYVFSAPLKFIDPSGLACVYVQSTGRLTCVNDSGEIYLDRIGFAGAGKGKNNPIFENYRNTGPVPSGIYRAGLPENYAGTGPISRRLIPVGATGLKSGRDRESFLIHGGRSSEGCPIINDPKGRATIPTGETVIVISGF